jgi:hypothetical protein
MQGAHQRTLGLGVVAERVLAFVLRDWSATPTVRNEKPLVEMALLQGNEPPARSWALGGLGGCFG